jgi:hypothetical protein
VERRQHDHAQPRVPGDDLLAQLQARRRARGAQLQVQQHHVRPRRRDRRQCLGRARRVPDYRDVALQLQDRPQALPHDRVVVDDDHTNPVSHHKAP